MYKEIRNTFHILVGKPHEKKPLDGLEGNNKTDHKDRLK
jgi:hypothetical protein